MISSSLRFLHSFNAAGDRLDLHGPFALPPSIIIDLLLFPFIIAEVVNLLTLAPSVIFLLFQKVRMGKSPDKQVRALP